MGLRERCAALNSKLRQDAILRQNDPVQTILEFVKSEIGKSAAEELDDTKSLILYFATDDDRRGFIEAVRGAKPGMVARPIG